jgi:hypothetical protein
MDSTLKQPNRQCVLPRPTELELGVIPGDEPGTAIRVRVEPGHEGYARIEQLAHSEDLGWYCQKSFVVPGAMIRPLVTHLRQADCLIPRPTVVADVGPLPFVRPVELPAVSQPVAAKRDA